MCRYFLTILSVVFLFTCCTFTTPVNHPIKEAYESVWERPEHALSLLQTIDEARLDTSQRMLYRLTYSIAAHRQQVDNPYMDLSAVIHHYRNQNKTDYLFVAIVQQAQFLGSQGAYTEALKLLHSTPQPTIFTVPPRMLSLYHSLYGFFLYRSGDYAQALQHYDSSQTLNFEHGFTDLLVSNVINMVNLPGCVEASNLDQFINIYEPYVNQSGKTQQRKFFNNIGNELKKNGDSLAAMNMYLKALEIDSSSEATRTRLNYAQILEHYGYTEPADSIYSIVLLEADSTVLHRLYHHLTIRAVENRDIAKARHYMLLYLEAVNHLYETRDRKELLEMQAKYNRSELLREAEHNRTIVLKFLLLFVAITILSYLVYSLSRIYQCYRLGNYLVEYCQLMYSYRTHRQQAEKDNRNHLQEEASYRQRMDELKGQISDLMKETNRFRTIYRIKTPKITITPQDISALNLFLQLSEGTMKYDAAQHRSTLYHWLNLVDGKFAERFSEVYPLLTPHDLDLCCFYRMGFDNDHISGLYGQYSDSIRRHRLRLYPLLSVKDKQSLDTLIQQF